MTSISKYKHLNQLDKMVNKYNNKYHNIIKMKPAIMRSSTYIDFDKKK